MKSESQKVDEFIDMSLSEIVKAMQDARADYVATCRDVHGLKKLKREFNPGPIVERLDNAIRAMIIVRNSIDSIDHKATT